MPPDNAPQPLLDRNYVDIDDWGREVGWDASFTQIDSGPLRARAAAFGTTRCLATRGEFSRSIHQLGTPPIGMLSFGLPDDDVETFRWCGRDAVGGDILNFNLASGFEGTTPAGFAGFVISFSQDLLDEIVASQGFDGDVLEQIRMNSIWDNASGATVKLRRRLSAIDREQRLAGHPAVADFFAETAITQLLQFLSRQAPDDRTDNAAQRRRAVRRVVEWAAQRDQCPVSVSELSRKAGVSSPTLYRGFMEEFGIGPKRYLNIRRLSRVRAELLSADTDVCIAEIANGWGFWHMGQFAADYRQHFGELPSETRGKRVAVFDN